MSQDEDRDTSRHEPARDERTGGSAAAARVQFQSQWVEQQIRIAQERGDFDNLPGAGKPIEGIDKDHDPDWWIKKLIEREHVTGVLPPALALRKEDAELAGTLDRLSTESEVRRELEDFNARIRRARMQLQGGPPVITAERDLDAEVETWQERRAARIQAQRAALKARDVATPRRGFFRRRQ